VLLALAAAARPWNLSAAGRLLMPVAVLAVAATFVHGPSLLLEYPFAYQPRAVVSMGALGAGIGSALYMLAHEVPFGPLGRRLFAGLSKGLLIGIAWSLVVVSYTYANAFRAQFEFEHSLITRLAYDIERSDALLRAQSVRTVAFVGAFPTSRIAANSLRKFPYLIRVMPRLIDNNWMWGPVVLSQYDVSSLDRRDWPLTDDQLQQLRDNGQATEIFASRAYRGFIADGTLLIAMSKPGP
jgi:hypothetical protein